MGRPLNPEELLDHPCIPDKILDVFDEQIRKKWNGQEATITMSEILPLVLAVMELQSSDIIFEKKWLDVEYLYREAGWTVEFEKPAYNESGESWWRFSKKRSVRRY